MRRFVACYDISSNRSRLKVMKYLKNKGFHAQLSFFELGSSDLPLRELKALLEKTDRFTLVRLSRRGKIRRIGSLFERTEWVL